MDIDSLAQALFGGRRAEEQEVETNATTRTYMGVAVSDSSDGTVRVDLGGDVTLPDDLYDEDGNVVAEWDGAGIEMSTSPQVREGQDVIVTLVGGTSTKRPMVTAVAGEGDTQAEAIDGAAQAAQEAWDHADEAAKAATAAQASADTAARAAGDAQTSADEAAESARTANENATKAIEDAAAASAAATAAQGSADSAAASAQTANENALQAIEDAGAASDAAQAAQGSADSAAESARTAQQTAEAAQQSANTAQGAANAAQASANAANAHATAALNSLSTVEDVVDTLTWITEHGTMAKTIDTAVDPSKVYFVRDNNGDYTVGGNRYSIVQEPVASGLSSYYELTIDKSVENYIATHLSVTNEGLWLTPTQSGGYRVLVATGGAGKTYPTAGTYIIDGSGVTVAQFTGTGISFADNRTFYIGDEDAYIFFDGNGHINIGGSNVTIGGSTTLAELLAKYDATITSDDISVSKTGGTATITVGGDSVTISDGATGAQGPKGDTGDQGPQGPKGNDGTSVTVRKVEYGTSASAGTQPSSWSTTVPTSIAKGQWLWVKTTYSDGTDATTKSYVGTDGEDGTSVFVQSATKSGDTTTVVIADSEGHTSTLTIKDGTDGTNGTNGQNGLTGYVHTAWANSADGKTDFSTTVSANKKYLGVYTDNTEADSTSYSKYSWSLIKGADGTSVTVSKVEYGTSTSASTQPSSWSETVPTSVTKGQWLWVKTTYSDSTTAVTKSYVGTDGTDGKSVYVQSSSKSGDTTTVVLTDGTTSTTLTIKDGEDGQNGTAGASGYVHTAWANSADGKTGFSTTVSAGKSYLGVYTDNTAADSQTYSDYSWSLIKGADGHSPTVTTTKNSDGSVTIYVDGTATSTVDAGEDGQTPTVTTTKNSDGSVTIYVNGTASNTVEAGADGTSYYTYVRYSANANGSGMVTTPTSATKYIGVYTGTSSSVPAYTSFKWSKYVGEDGSDADPLTVTSHDVDYQLSTSGTTAPTGNWSTTPLAPTTTQYLWTRTTLKFSDNTESVSYSVGGKAGTNGQNGTNGTNGTDGGRWYAGTKITGTSTTATVFSGSGITAAVVGDMYLNTSTYNTYRCTVAGNASTAKWVYTANIKGATGEQGPQGETGAQGPQGETGSAGTNGVSITGVEHQYYLSTSSTSQAGGSWAVKPAAYVKGRYYWERWKVSFSSGNPTYTTATLAEEVTSAWTAIEQNDEAIALKANSSDVYTKTQTDGKITQEVTDRTAAITAKANEITSTVSQNYTTKQEFADLEVGGRNLLGSTSNPSSKSVVQNDTSSRTFGDIGNYNDPVSAYLFEDYDGYSNSVKWTSTGTGNRGVGWYTKAGEIKAGTEYTFTCKVKSSVAVSVHTHTAWRNGSATATYTGWTSAGATTVPANTWTDYSYTFEPHSSAQLDWEYFVAICFTGSSSGVTFQVAHAKLEKGNRATDWTPAPEDIEERVEKAESAITQNATNINAKVSKNDVINQINLSTEGVLIDADRVEINGAAVFNAIKSSTDAVYDAKGSAATVQSNLDNLDIGGRNLLQGSNRVLANGSVLDTKTVFNVYLWSTPSGGYSGYKQMASPVNISSVGRFVYTFNAQNDSQNYWCIKHNGSAHDYPIWFKNSVDVKTGDELTLSFDVIGYNPSVADGLEIRNFKLERGNRATDWTPAPEDVVTRTQRIYYRWNSATAPAAPSTWVTKGDDGSALWTKMHVAITSTHKYIYTCEQYEMADGTLGHTDVLLDNTITVIDGGNIITGSVTANKLNASDINASKTLTVGAMTDAAAATILNSNVQVGGRNLFRLSNSVAGYLNGAAGDIVGQSNHERTTEYIQVEANTEYVLQAWYDTSNPTSSYEWICLVWFDANKSNGTQAVREHMTSVNYKSWSLTSPSNAAYVRVSSRWVDAGYMYANVKLERGNKPTDWTPAPEDVDADIEEVATNVEAASESAGDAMEQALAATGAAETAQSAAEEAQSVADDALRSASDIASSLSQLDQSINQWATFTPEKGLTLGASDSDFDLNITNTRAAFRYQGNVTAYSSGTEYVAPRMTSDEFHVGGFMWTTYGDAGGMALKWVGLGA